METPKVNEAKQTELKKQPETPEKAAPEKNKKTVIIIGASSGIGYESALKLIGRNYHVVNISRTPCPLERVKNYAADITVGSTLEKALHAVAEKTQYFYALVYCAGFSMAAPIEYVNQKDYRYLFEVNFFGALRAIQSAVPFMKKKGGRIVLVSSMGGLLPVAFDSFYSSSKAALDMLAKSAAIELEPYNIRLTSVQPGGTSTSFTFKRKVYGDEDNGEYASRLNKATAALANIEQGGMSAGEVARTIADVLDMKKPPAQVQCGGKNKFYAVAQRLLPGNMSLYLNKKKYRQ
ncbi:MAG TPA: SDR family NAD(P)-dependent oxidoreductase [Candidatus Borkfalkia excrementavium]|uniref:SDR family NAD(P)-dependent oxidoreductase n=1 Tax=Candidatus Borkfalkia excrementavium TaxID=2838505 RepID=A0A9D1Z8I4_9FIRM|nr:SDR family NAD(P)-dependent oxidoreductase [Candidatus Borkfalkia excrementavium]